MLEIVSYIFAEVLLQLVLARLSQPECLEDVIFVVDLKKLVRIYNKVFSVIIHLDF